MRNLCSTRSASNDGVGQTLDPGGTGNEPRPSCSNTPADKTEPGGVGSPLGSQEPLRPGEPKGDEPGRAETPCDFASVTGPWRDKHGPWCGTHARFAEQCIVEVFGMLAERTQERETLAHQFRVCHDREVQFETERNTERAKNAELTHRLENAQDELAVTRQQRGEFEHHWNEALDGSLKQMAEISQLQSTLERQRRKSRAVGHRNPTEAAVG